MVEFIRSIFNPEKSAEYGIVALLDKEHDTFIRNIWHEMEAELDIKIPFDNPIPHITHLQAGKVKEDELHRALQQFAETQAPYTIRTTGIGIFTGTRNAVYVPVVRNPNLAAIQTNLIASLAGTIEEIAPTHMINNWIPHITLVMGLSGANVDKLAAIVKRLAQRNFAWEFKVTHLAVLDGKTDSQEAPFTVELKD